MVQMTFRTHALQFAYLSAAFLLLASFVSPAHAQSDIQAQIEEHNAKIKAIEDEIATFQNQLNILGTQKQTLQTTIKTIDTSRAQTTSQLKVTQNQISASNLKLKQLSGEITQTEYEIELDRQILAQSIREIAEADTTSLSERIFSSQSLGDLWSAVDSNMALNEALKKHTADLTDAKEDLSEQRTAEDKTKSQLTDLNTKLANEKKQLDIAIAEKNKLLAQTKSQETVYQDLIAKKRAEQKTFEAALNALESGLTSVGSVGIPAIGTGVLSWPYSAEFMATCRGKSAALGNNYCITQYFGNTAFSTANPQIYNGSGHNAIDMGSPVGTPIQSAASGTVLGIGNTDAVPGCYSFGKWVVVKHGNGLATLYAHLSSINVSSGQAVSMGQVIGNSGMTGYATGPHLHFGVYVASGIQIMSLGDYRGATSPCARATMPVAPKDAYLNPMSYL